MNREDCPTCQLIATGGIFYDAQCEIQDKDGKHRTPFFKGFKPTFYFRRRSDKDGTKEKK